ncbi:MAG: electron transfer flavoprotein subunit alpha [Chloroflexi bacterium HGW-Chloroflexi-5]|jgi:electron transfer flavoprotein alpha subunit|nr:MAG: electron transfer flavoprotein subunit alpha [Chloroflexi bacterium HGW-Chloroflexi-5]
MLIIDHERCTLCKLCIRSCPFGAFFVEEDLLKVNESCTLCGTCTNVCRFNALHIERKLASSEELAKYKGVMVWIELDDAADLPKPKKVSLELLGKGHQLANDLGEELIAVVLTDSETIDLQTLGHYGADRVIFCHHDLLKTYSTDGFTSVLCAVISSNKPAVVLYGATPHGRDLAPRVAARLKLGLTADCTGLEIDEQRQMVQTRPAFGGNIMASIITPYNRPQTSTVRPNVFPIPAVDEHHQAVVENFTVTLTKAAIRTRVVEKNYIEEGCEESIENARVLVAAGRGCQKASNLELLRTLACQLGGGLAGSRAIVEQGWIPHTQQVGQSGTTVGPELYIAAGISGAIQHQVGMSSSKTIIAVNKDPEAAIFKLADLGVVGDAQEILPKLSKLIEQETQKTG